MKPLKSYFLSQRDIPIAISNSDTKSINSKACEIEPKRLRIEREKERERITWGTHWWCAWEIWLRGLLRASFDDVVPPRLLLGEWLCRSSSLGVPYWLALGCFFAGWLMRLVDSIAQTFRPSLNTYIYIWGQAQHYHHLIGLHCWICSFGL